MRYEAKHRISKMFARSSSNKRNICKTLAIKHQLQLNEIFMKGKLCNSINIGPQKELDSGKHQLIQNELNLNTVETLIRVNWAEVRGTRYKLNTILTLDILDDNNPQFISVKNVFLYASNRVIFECSLLKTVGFNEHVYCYEIISENNNSRFIFQDSFISPIPNTLNIVSNGMKFVTVRSPLKTCFFFLYVL